MNSIDELSNSFNLGDKLSFSMVGEIPVVNIQTENCKARVAMQGAQLIDWTPTGRKPVLWLSPQANFINGKSIRGGIPVCWPWFGAHQSSQEFPAHGYARTVQWELSSASEVDHGEIILNFILKSDESQLKMWPYLTPLELRMQIGEQLELELTTRNVEKRPIQISEALHTYFAVSDARQARVSGLNEYDYLDKVQDFERFQQKGDIHFEAELDRIYLNTENTCVIEDNIWQRRIYIEKEGSRSTVVWNPWAEKSDAMGDMGEDGYLSMLCVESANAADNIVTIKPGEEHRLRVRYRVE